ncbi:hypothetical protein HN011_005650 [Eciton burchellii]|nr:hypothetical protein HN011_005650 [Eciton burchellii]
MARALLERPERRDVYRVTCSNNCAIRVGQAALRSALTEAARARRSEERRSIDSRALRDVKLGEIPSETIYRQALATQLSGKKRVEFNGRSFALSRRRLQIWNPDAAEYPAEP